MYKDESILSLTRKELLSGKVPVDVYPDGEALFKNIARVIADEIAENNCALRKTLMIVPLGPVGQYKYLAGIVNGEHISLKDVTFINMDEYMADEHTLIPESDPLSFKGAMYKEFYSNVDPELLMPEEQRIFPAPNGAAHIGEVISAHGGVDMCIGGIGLNGHVAFNEPPEDGMPDDEFCGLSVRVVSIARETIVTNGINEFEGAYEFMPRFAATVGFKEILSARKIRLYCFRPWHRMVVRKAVCYPPSAEFPVTLLRGSDLRIGIPEYLA